jgi:V/A-type H+-transporting ATPase subunit D
MVRDVKPTRSELIKLKKQVDLAFLGHRLLKMKRDGLIIEFLKVLKDARDIRRRIIQDYVEADEKIGVAQALEGSIALQSVAYSISQTADVDVQMKNIMGVVVPQVEYKSVVKRTDKRGYGVIGTSVSISETASAYERLLDDVIKAAEIETTIKRLIKNIEKTKRRVNALEFKVIPELQEVETFIRMRLEELERESIFRLKRIKAKGREEGW